MFLQKYCYHICDSLDQQNGGRLVPCVSKEIGGPHSSMIVAQYELAQGQLSHIVKLVSCWTYNSKITGSIPTHAIILEKF